MTSPTPYLRGLANFWRLTWNRSAISLARLTDEQLYESLQTTIRQAVGRAEGKIPGFETDDLAFGVAWTVIADCRKTWNPDQATFTTYVAGALNRHFAWVQRETYRRLPKTGPMSSLDSVDREDEETGYQAVESKLVAESLLAALPTRHRRTATAIANDQRIPRNDRVAFNRWCHKNVPLLRELANTVVEEVGDEQQEVSEAV